MVTPSFHVISMNPSLRISAFNLDKGSTVVCHGFCKLKKETPNIIILVAQSFYDILMITSLWKAFVPSDLLYGL